jgi:hypothetical protein
MALTLEQLQAQRDALFLAITSGELRVSYDNKTVEYRSFPEMRGALDLLDREIAKTSGQPVVARQKRMVTRDGFGDFRDLNGRWR